MKSYVQNIVVPASLALIIAQPFSVQAQLATVSHRVHSGMEAASSDIRAAKRGVRKNRRTQGVHRMAKQSKSSGITAVSIEEEATDREISFMTSDSGSGREWQRLDDTMASMSLDLTESTATETSTVSASVSTAEQDTDEASTEVTAEPLPVVEASEEATDEATASTPSEAEESAEASSAQEPAVAQAQSAEMMKNSSVIKSAATIATALGALVALM